MEYLPFLMESFKVRFVCTILLCDGNFFLEG